MLTESAPIAWKYLDGIVCLYKPALDTMNVTRRNILFKLCQDLNSMKCRELRKRVNIVGDTSKPMTVKIESNYADHPLVVGPRYMEKDFRLYFANRLGVRTSGVLVTGINDGTKFAHELKETKPLNVYHVKGQFGLLTDTLFSDGKPKYKCNYEYITQDAIDRVVAAIQALHQKNQFALTGVRLQSQVAYDLASSGFIRPTLSDAPVVYNMKCINLNLPEFTLEITTVNETEDYLQKVVYDIGDRLKNVASTVSLRCIRVGFFTVEHSLLKKHWNLENVFSNMRKCYEIVKQNEKVDAQLQKVEDYIDINKGSETEVEVVDEFIKDPSEVIDESEKSIKEIS